MIFAGILFIMWFFGLLWLVHPFKAGKWFFHDIMGWHKPDETYSYDGCSSHSRCRFCKQKIMEDSQGNWFVYDEGE